MSFILYFLFEIYLLLGIFIVYFGKEDFSFSLGILATDLLTVVLWLPIFVFVLMIVLLDSLAKISKN